MEQTPPAEKQHQWRTGKPERHFLPTKTVTDEDIHLIRRQSPKKTINEDSPDLLLGKAVPK